MKADTELVRLASLGDAHAFACLYETVYQDLYRFALYTLRHPQDAEDAVSETVTDAFGSIQTLRNPEAFRSWIFRILTAKCARKIRQYTNSDEELSESMESKQPDLGEHSAVRMAFAALPAMDRMIISMSLFAGYSSLEIGTYLDMKPNTVRSRHSRALKKLQDDLK